MNKNKIILIALFSLFLIVRLAALFLVEPVSSPKTWEYEEVANNILQGKGLFYTFYQTPYRATYLVLYPILCATIYRFTQHSFLALKLLQLIISLITCLLIYKISLRLFNNRVAILSLLLVGFHPGLAYYSIRLHSLVIDVFLCALSVFCLLKVLDGKNLYRNAIFSGISFGLAMLSRSTLGPFLIFALIITFLRFKNSGHNPVAIVFIIAIFTAVILLPLGVRNYLIFKKIVLTPTESGINFWLGYNSNATGTNKTLEGKFILDIAPEDFRRAALNLGEFEQKAYFYQEGLRFIRDYPLKSLGLFLKKIKYFWWFTPTQGMEYPKLYFMIYKIYWMFILPSFLLGLYLGFGKRPMPINNIYGLTLIMGLLISVTLVQASFNLDGRHRWLVEPFILIFAANGLDGLWQYLKPKEKEQR